jgi:hypothetical protein
MDPIKNPFSPGAGSPPPALAGRNDVLQNTRVLLGRIRSRRPEKSLLLTGLRGVGKTVLLNEMERIAQTDGYRTILIEAYENKSLGQLLVPPLRRLFFELNKAAGVGDKARKGLAVLKSFIGAIKVSVGDFELGLDIEPERGTADSGDIETDVPNLFVALAEAAEERGAPVAILIDEIQYLGRQELGALIMAMHKMQQRLFPVVLMGAGLPILPGLAGQSKSYAERLFSFPDIGPLSEPDAAKALNDPVKKEGAAFDKKALQEIYRLTKGYPYFLQEWGYQAWNHAATPHLTLEVIKTASPSVVTRLDENFFRVRFSRLTPQEKNFLRAMADCGRGPVRTADVADNLGVPISRLGPLRACLIKKGMIYSPSHGDLAFTVPLFDAFLVRTIPAERQGKRQ